MSKRRIAFIAAAILLLIAIAACMMVVGRGHTLYFDNKKLEYDGQEYDTYRRINVFVNGEQVAKLSAKDRGMASFMGQKFSFDIEVMKEKDSEPVNYSFTVRVPYGEDGIILNLPGMIAGLPEEAYTSIFVPAVVEEPEEDEAIVIDEFGMTEGDEAEGAEP